MSFAFGLLHGIDARAEPTVALKAGAHLGGVRTSESDRQVAFGPPSLNSSSSLYPGFRLAMHAMFAPHPNFALGAQLGVLTWQSARADDFDARRSWYIDLALAPEGRLLTADAWTLYVVPTIGLVYAAWNEVSTARGGAIDARADVGWGLEYGLSVGARLALDDAYGALLEVGPTFHMFEAALHADAPSQSVDVATTTWQLAVLTGMYF